jgi:hypothetical protein
MSIIRCFLSAIKRAIVEDEGQSIILRKVRTILFDFGSAVGPLQKEQGSAAFNSTMVMCWR